MNNFDSKIKYILSKEIDKPLEYEQAIKKAFLNKGNEKKHIMFYKMGLISCCFVMLGTVVLATSHIIYEKVWKEPIIKSKEEAQQELEQKVEKVKEKVKDEEKEQFITEKEAIEIANKILNTLGYENKFFENIELIRDYDFNIHYLLSTNSEVGNGILINLNPITGELEYFCDNDVLKNIEGYDEISEEYAKEIANQMYKELCIISEGENVYEIIEVSKQSEDNMWQVSYAQKYNDLIYEDSMFSTVFSVVNGKTLFYIIKGKTNKNFKSNEIILSENEAKDIAINKEKEFSNLDIDDINVKLSIEKMNLFIYYLENNINENNDEIYKIDDVARIVWVVEIKHNKHEKIRENNLQIVKEQYNKKYYIDATTGEIIGGEQAEI